VNRLIASLLALGFCLSSYAFAADGKSKKAAKRPSHKSAATATTKVASRPHSSKPYRGWGYLVERLRANGVSQQDIDAIYTDPRMPEFTFIPFSVRPKEPASMYTNFTKPTYRELGASFLDQKKEVFDHVEETLKVPREVVTAILVVESQIGRFTGNQLIVYRLSRLASANAPENLRENYHEQKKKDPSVTFEQIQRRGRYLEQTFLPEIPALISIAKQSNIEVLSMKGSIAGAFGMPQFLPSAFMKFGMDGNKDGTISLHNEEDAMWSTANYLANYGFREDIPLQEKRSIIWRYNKSKSYIDTILRLSNSMRQESPSGSTENNPKNGS
jgi:membrane-bound lytic murein transglycosylase B